MIANRIYFVNEEKLESVSNYKSLPCCIASGGKYPSLYCNNCTFCNTCVKIIHDITCRYGWRACCNSLNNESSPHTKQCMYANPSNCISCIESTNTTSCKSPHEKDLSKKQKKVRFSL